MMQEMDILVADAPTSGVIPSPIRLWFTAPELGHPLIDDNHDRPLHPLVGPFLREYLSRHKDMNDDDDEMGHLYTGLGDTRVLARTMLEDWETEPAVYDDDQSETACKCHPRRNRERFLTPHTARDPNKIQEVELESEDLQGMIRQPPKVGAIRFHHEPESSNTSHADVTATKFQGTTSVLTSRGPYQPEGTRWHFLTKVFSNPESFKFDFHSDILLQERLDENPKYRSFSWQVLRKAFEFFGAKTYIGETGLTTPPFFSNARRGTKIMWGVLDDSPLITNWNGLDPTEQAEITPTLETSNNWNIFTHPLGAEDAATPTPLIPKGTQRILHTKGKAGRERGWWRTGTDKLASYGLETKVWIS